MGLGIEALGVLVVAVLVVLGGHAVERRIELFGVRVHALVGLLEGQGDAATLEVMSMTLTEDLFADLDDLVRSST